MAKKPPGQTAFSKINSKSRISSLISIIISRLGYHDAQN
jgi:hypothetical protein